MLILSHTDALRINLHQFCKRIHQSSSDAHSTTHGNILIRELISCNLRSRIDRSAILAHHIDIYRMNEIDAMQPVAGFAACSTVTYSHCLHLIHLYHALDGSRSLALPVAGRMRINDFMMNQIALRIETASLATIGKTRVNRHHAFLSERSRQQKLAQVFGEDHNSLLIRLLLAERSKFGFNARLQQSLKGIIHSLTHQSLAFTETMYIMTLQFILTLLIIS